MARPSPLTWLPLWQRALDPEVEIGIAFKVRGVTRDYMQNILGECRRMSGDPALRDLVMFAPGGDHTDELWICKREVELDDARQER